MIRDAVDGDAEALARIYNYYIEHSPATFEEKAYSRQTRLEKKRNQAADYDFNHHFIDPFAGIPRLAVFIRLSLKNFKLSESGNTNLTLAYPD